MAPELGLGITPWSPLKGGVLSGKYTRTATPPTVEPGRGQWVMNHLNERTYGIVDVLLRQSPTQAGATPGAGRARVGRRHGPASPPPSSARARWSSSRTTSRPSTSRSPRSRSRGSTRSSGRSSPFPHEFLKYTVDNVQGGTTVNGRPSKVWHLAPRAMPSDTDQLEPALILDREVCLGPAVRGLCRDRQTEHREKWAAAEAAVRLMEPQRALIAGFTRTDQRAGHLGDVVRGLRRPVPDAAADRGGEPRRAWRCRFLDRDEHADLSERLRICGGLRVPTVVFMNEDFEFVRCSATGRSPAYRAIAARQLGPSARCRARRFRPRSWPRRCRTGWRVRACPPAVRLSPKLRERYGD